MSSEWKEYTVEQLVSDGVLAPPLDGNHGAIHPKAADFVPVGVPFIMASDMKDGRVDTQSCAFISSIQAKSLRKGFARAGDVLLSHKATIGRTALVEKTSHEYLVLTPQVTYYRVIDSRKINNRYLKYYFDSAPFQQVLSSWAGAGSTRAYIGITAQRKLPVVLPPIEVQNDIAAMVGTLDDRITLLRETNKTLESIAQALFKSWFVDFDPVRAKMEGRQPEGMDEATAALFPDSFEGSELGLIPKGWRVGQLSELLKLYKGSVNPGATPSTEYLHYSLPAYDADMMAKKELGSAIKSNKTIVPQNAVLFSKLNPVIPRIWLPVEFGSHAICSTEFLPFVPTNESNTPYIYCLLKSSGLRDQIVPLASGTSNSHQRIRPDSILSLANVLPNARVIEKFETVVESMLARAKANQLSIQLLRALRDTLLPRLISGKLRLPDVHQQVETAIP